MSELLQPAVYSVRAGSPAVAGATTGPTQRIVFLHGLFGRGRNFAKLASALAPEAESLLVDLPNHGKSAWTSHFDYNEIADLVAAHLREDFAAAGPVDVVGHSMGGKVAMVLALRHPDLVRRLVVIDISPVDSSASPSSFKHLIDSLAGVDLASITGRSDADAALLGPIPDNGVRGFLLQNLKRGDAGFEWEPNLRLLREELPIVMGFPEMTGYQFTGPVLWIRGGKSDYVQDEHGPVMRTFFPSTRRITIRESGHWVHSEQPEETLAALKAFLL